MKRTLLALLCVTALGILWTLAPKASADSNDLTSWTFTPVDVPLPNVTQTYVRDMNPAGQIVGHYSQTGAGTRGFLLSDGEFAAIAARVPGNTQARGINPQGDIVGNVWGGGIVQRRFLLSQGVVTEFGYPGASYTIAKDIDAPGDIVGYYGLGSPVVNHCFVYRNGAFTTIDVPGARWTTVRGINPEGEMVGVYEAVDPDGVSRGHGFPRGKDGSFTTIDGPGVPPNGNANGINPRGWIVGEYNAVAGVLPRLGFVLRDGSYTTIMYPGATRTRPFKITPDGQHIVGFYDDLHGFVLSRKAPT